MVLLRTCQGPLRKETVCSAVGAFLKQHTYAGAGEGGPSVVGFFFNLPPVSCKKPLNSRAPVGRTYVALWKHIWAGSVGFPVFGLCHPTCCRTLPRTPFLYWPGLQRAPLCGGSLGWLGRVMRTLELKLRAWMRGLKEAKKKDLAYF